MGSALSRGADRLPLSIFPPVTPFLLRETAATGYKSRVLCFPREPDRSGGLPFYNEERWAMPDWLIRQRTSMALLCCIIIVPFSGCAKKAASSAGEATSATANAKGTPVETVKPDTLATVPEERAASSMMNAAAEAPALSGEGPALSASSAAPPASLSQDLGSLVDVFFDFDQHAIRGDAQSILSADAAWINGKPGQTIVIEGHCDERGTQAYNLVLGDKRARAVKRYLQDLGVSASRLKTTSYGELRPFCKEREETCYQQNRRAHFVAH
jgi:peptidoglycan-associated lipoprotein